MIVLDHQPAGPEQRVAVDIFHTSVTSTNTTFSKQDIEQHDIHDIRYQGKEHRGMPIPKDAKPVTSLLFSINEALRQPDQTLVQLIPQSAHPNTSGSITLHVEPTKFGHENDDETTLKFHIRGYAFPSMRRNFLERPDYYYEIYRKTTALTTIITQQHDDETATVVVEEDTWRLVYRSPCEKGMLNPMWQVDQLSIAALCNHDLNRDVRIQVVDLDGKGGRNLLGSCETNVHGIMGAVVVDGGNCDTSKAFSLFCKKGQKKVGKMIVLEAAVHMCGSSVLVMEDAVAVPVLGEALVLDGGSASLEIMAPPALTVEVMAVPAMVGRPTTSFQHYVNQCDIDLCMAVDFTDGNGRLSDTKSAHAHSKNNRLNDYEWSMSVVSETIRDLNATHEYPMWGFGGCFQNDHNKTHPIFQCGATPKAKGTRGLLEAYKTTFQTGLTPGKQRTFDNILMAAAHHAKKQLEESRRTNRRLSYTLLTVLTVGSDSDILGAKEKLVTIQGAPLSVLFLRIPTARSSSWSADSLAKLQTYTSHRNCRRRFYTCLDDGSVGNRDANKLSAKVMQVLQEEMPAYFQS
jgi:hypothetical protein